MEIDTISLKTLGCRLNSYESSAMKEIATKVGLKDVVIINTCAVTKEAVRKSCQVARKAKRKNPNKQIIVTGCAAQINPSIFESIPGVDWIVGNSQKLEPKAWEKITNRKKEDSNKSENLLVKDILKVKELTPHLTKGFDNRTVAYVQVQNGCDHRCTFCIIPYGRGNSRSIPAGVVVNQIKELVASGYNEVLLTGVDITSWGGDLPGKPKLGYLVASILQSIPTLPRLRLSSIDPAEVDELLLKTLSDDERLMPHLHFSIQAGNDLILKRMKRRHLRDDVIKFCKKIKRMRNDVVFGADFIAGFPTESEEMFEDTLALVDECNLTWLHVFPFSPRQGTPAARMPQNSRDVILRRAEKLRELGDKKKQEYFVSRINQVEQVLIESNHKGRTEHYGVVSLRDEERPGQLKKVRITGFTENCLEGIRVT